MYLLLNMKILNFKKIVYGSMLSSGIILYSKGYFEDLRIIAGGLVRGLRCAKTGLYIVNRYMNVIIK